MLTEENYSELADQLGERLSGTDPEGHMRQIARNEADKRILSFIVLVGIIWAIAEYRWVGILCLLGVGIGWFIYKTDFDPSAERHLVVSMAEDFVRLNIIKEIDAGGENVWELLQKDFDADTIRVAATDNYHWEKFWERTYDCALIFEKFGPKKRKKVLYKATIDARGALIKGKNLADRESAELVFWASDALERLKQAE